MFLENCQVLDNIQISNSYYLLKLKVKKSILAAKPGQFYMLKCKNESTILRRPISIHSVNEKKNIIEFYYEVKGKGTNELKNITSEQFINLQGPLGNGFNTEIKNKYIAIVGGGMGIAPLNFLIKKLAKNNSITFICGGKNKDSLKILDNFNLEKINTIITTDDGSLGNKGNVASPLINSLKNKKFDKVYTCGPELMMTNIASICSQNNISCELSLEERMACGVGACVGCSILTKDGMKKVCKDGPIFNSNIIVNKGGEN